MNTTSASMKGEADHGSNGKGSFLLPAPEMSCITTSAQPSFGEGLFVRMTLLLKKEVFCWFGP